MPLKGIGVQFSALHNQGSCQDLGSCGDGYRLLAELAMVRSESFQTWLKPSAPTDVSWLSKTQVPNFTRLRGKITKSYSSTRLDTNGRSSLIPFRTQNKLEFVGILNLGKEICGGRNAKGGRTTFINMSLIIYQNQLWRPLPSVTKHANIHLDENCGGVSLNSPRG